jgi:CMP-2-keto-3-deoxyoctulosonic acid synthetase
MYNPKHKYMRKLGIYSYRADFLPTFINMAGLRSEGSDGQPVLAKSLIT